MTPTQLLPGRPASRRVACSLAVALFLLAACEKKPAGPPPVPKVRARVVTIRTTIQPGRKVFRHQILSANGRVRVMSEVDQRRFLNIADNSVTFVDDIAKTHRTVPFEQLLAERRALLNRPPPVRVEPAEIVDTKTERPIGRFQTRQYTIRLGGYEREISISTQPLLGENFFPLFVVSEPQSEPFASVLRPVHEQLVALRGFPIADRSSMKYDGQELKVEKVVERVEDKDVPLAWMTIPPGYRDITPAPKESPADRRPASSRLPGRKAPAGE